MIRQTSLMVLAWCLVSAVAVQAQVPSASPAPDEQAQKKIPEYKLTIPIPREPSDAWKKFSELKIWDDGYSEMSYYDAECTIYGKPRKYTRVHLMNRQDMDPQLGIKAGPKSGQTVPAFKFVVAEEIPTENYNYRFLTSAFVERPSLEPLKMTISSHEWCGSTFKWFKWDRPTAFPSDNWSLDICWFSYFEGEGDGWWPWPRPNIDGYEFLPLYARAVVASGEKREMHLLRSMHHTHRPDPIPIDAVLKIDGKPRKVTVPMGSFEAQRVVVEWEGAETWFDVETAAPHRVLAFKADDVQGKLKFVERRAYWDRDWKSGFHKPNQAP